MEELLCGFNVPEVTGGFIKCFFDGMMRAGAILQWPRGEWQRRKWRQRGAELLRSLTKKPGREGIDLELVGDLLLSFKLAECASVST